MPHIFCDNCIVAEDIIREEQTGTITLVRILGDGNVDGLPMLLKKCVWYALFRSSEGRSRVKVTTRIKIDDMVIFETPQEIIFEEDMRRILVLRFDGLLVPRAGKLLFGIYDEDDQLVGSHIIFLHPQGPRPTQRSAVTAELPSGPGQVESQTNLTS